MTTPIRPSAARMRMRVGPRAAPTNAGAAPDPMLTTVLRPPRSPMQAQARHTSKLVTAQIVGAWSATVAVMMARLIDVGTMPHLKNQQHPDLVLEVRPPTAVRIPQPAHHVWLEVAPRQRPR